MNEGSARLDAYMRAAVLHFTNSSGSRFGFLVVPGDNFHVCVRSQIARLAALCQLLSLSPMSTLNMDISLCRPRLFASSGCYRSDTAFVPGISATIAVSYGATGSVQQGGGCLTQREMKRYVAQNTRASFRLPVLLPDACRTQRCPVV